MNSLLPTQTQNTVVWTVNEIGKTVCKASAIDNSTLKIRTNGTQLIYGPDNFGFLERRLIGDGTLTARIVSLDNTDAYAKAAVQIRQELDENAINAMMEWTPSGWAYFQFKPTVGGASNYGQYAYTKLPLWIRITRLGDQITGLISEDGKSFKKVGTTSLQMPQQVHIGLAITSNAKEATTAIIDNIVLEGNSLDGGSHVQEAVPGSVRSLQQVRE